MDIKKRIAELEAMHAEQVRLHQAAEQQRDNARMNVTKIEGALEILREQLTEQMVVGVEEKATAQGA